MIISHSIDKSIRGNFLRNYKLKVKSQKSGYVLISVLVILMVLVAMMYFFADALFSEMAISRNQKSAGQAFHLAEAGVQEAVWRIQNHNATHSEFLKANGYTQFSHPAAFLPGGSYTVEIKNTAAAVATITATGFLQMGSKIAQRKIITHVYQAIDPGPYTKDSALFVGGPDPGNMSLHNLDITYGSGYARGSIMGGANIDIGTATIDVSRDILANGAITTKNSTITLGLPDPPPIPPGFPGGVQQSHYSPDFMMPDFTGLDTLKALAQSHSPSQFYTSAQFATLIKTQTTFNGVVYVGGTGGIALQKNNLTINGTLVSEGSISINNDSLTINHTSGPSGLVTLGSLEMNNAKPVKVEGLFYIAQGSSASNNSDITVTGAILAHAFTANNITLKLNFKPEWVNETLEGGDQTPVIKMDHWEEEY